jgi:superfamily II DNA or RNA helicase
VTAIELRPYQLEALDKIEAARARGVMSQMGVAATGLGKRSSSPRSPNGGGAAR